MKKMIFLGLAAATVVAGAAPAAAQYRDRGYGYDRSDDRYDRRYTNQRRGRAYGAYSATDRDGDGYDDRDLNFDHFIDAREHRRAGTGSFSATDRDGDGYDDRDLNFDRFIDAREHRRAGTGSFSATDRDGDGYDDRDLNGDRFIDEREHAIAGTGDGVPVRRRFRRR